MKAKSEGRRQNEECRSGEKLGSGIRAQPLGCRGLRQLWRTRERGQIVESAVTVRREDLRTVYVRRVVEREGVIKCLTVRNLMSPGCRKSSVHAATFSHFRHFEPGSGWVGCRRGVETRPAWAVCGGEGRLPSAQAWPQQAAPPRHRPAAQAVGSRLARTSLDFGRARWVPGNAGRMNGKAKDLNERNTFFICDRDERGSGIKEKCLKALRRFLPLGLIWFQKSARLRVCVWCAPGGEAG